MFNLFKNFHVSIAHNRIYTLSLENMWLFFDNTHKSIEQENMDGLDIRTK